MHEASLGIIIKIWGEPNYLYVCQSVSWLTSLLKLDKSRDISCSGWDVVLKFLGDIPGMFIHYFQIIINFVYVCQSVSWLTSLLKLDKYRDISCSWWNIFLNFFGHIPEMFVHLFWILRNFLYVCQSISWLTNLLKLGQYGDISCPGWDIFLKYFGDISGIFWQYFQINANCLYVCQSVSWLTSLEILNKCRDISCSERDIFLTFV